MTRLWCRRIAAGEDQSQAARALLGEMMERPDLEVLHEESGKPFLRDCPHISLSHTAGAVAVAASDTPVGVDVERVRLINPGLPRRVMSDGEYDWFQRRGARPEDFFTLWTLKESYYKYLGTGLPGIPNRTEFYLEDGLWRLKNVPQKFFVYQEKELHIALCGDAQSVVFQMIPKP